MAEPRILIASLASVVAINGQGTAIPVGLVQSFRAEKRFNIEPVLEWGSYLAADLLIHGVNATFSWGRAYTAGFDLVSQGLLPSDQGISQFTVITLRIIDQPSQRQICIIDRALVETVSMGADSRTHLRQDVSGQAISVLFESEIQ